MYKRSRIMRTSIKQEEYTPNKSRLRLRLLAVLFIVGVGQTLFAAPIVYHSGMPAEVFHSAYEAFEKYELIAGKMLYQEDDEDFFSKGYRPENTQLIEGAVWRDVYDYPAGLSSAGVYAGLIKAMENSRFNKIFSCIGEDCGEFPGWKLYLGKHALGETKYQYYAAYKKLLDNGSIMHLAAYVNESDSRPRLIIDKMYPLPIDDFSLNLELSALRAASGWRIVGTKLDNNTILFSESSVEPDADPDEELVLIASFIIENNLYKYTIVGHTDNSGSPSANERLSRQRAEYIRSLLVLGYGVPAGKLKIYGAGETQPAASNLTEEGRILNRRVNVFWSN